MSTVRCYFYAWWDAGLFDAINTVLVMNLRAIEGREASPIAGVIDSQWVKTTERGEISGYDTGEKVRQKTSCSRIPIVRRISVATVADQMVETMKSAVFAVFGDL